MDKYVFRLSRTLGKSVSLLKISLSIVMQNNLHQIGRPVDVVTSVMASLSCCRVTVLSTSMC